MEKAIVGKRSLTRLALRVAVITSITLIAFLFAACDVNVLSGQADLKALALTDPRCGTCPDPEEDPETPPSDCTSPVPLLSASTFAVMGYAGVTNDVVGASPVITGDLGAGPGAPSVTGFDVDGGNTIVYGTGGTVTDGLGVVSGTIYAGGPDALQGQTDAQAAYNYLVLQTPGTTDPNVVQLDGQTLTPGVYRFGSANLLVGGTLYLDFQNDNNALFIFQIGSTLVTMANSKVVAINNPVAQGNPVNLAGIGPNVYWAVGSSATIDGSEFLGTVIAVASITMESRANDSLTTIVSGRMWALGASVTMVNSTITAAVCSNGGTVPPAKPCDFVTGGGWIDVDSGAQGHKWNKWYKSYKWYKTEKATFGVSGGIKNGAFWGQLSYHDHGKNGVWVKSTEVTAYIVIDDVTRRIEGIAKVNGEGSYTYTVVVSDNGERGRNDTFSIELSDGYSYSASGTLKGGNIQLHTTWQKLRDRYGKSLEGTEEDYVDEDQQTWSEV